MMSTLLDSAPQIVAGTVLGVLLFALGLAVGNYHANPLVDAFDVPPAELTPTDCPDCGSPAADHGLAGCTESEITCTNTAEDVMQLATAAARADEILELIATIEDLLGDATHEANCVLVVHDVDVDDYRCTCLIGELHDAIRATLTAGRT